MNKLNKNTITNPFAAKLSPHSTALATSAPAASQLSYAMVGLTT